MRRNSQPLLIALAAWLVPGLGHFLLGRTGRAILFFIAVGGLAMTGFQMRGNVFSSHYSDLFGMVGYLTDMASGVFYLLARLVERAGPDVSCAAGDYGTRFIATAGVVNLVAVIDAYEIAAGRRS
jgi:TM2 domain-containing membrane protein YozV